jgi:hypothetical protein
MDIKYWRWNCSFIKMPTEDFSKKETILTLKINETVGKPCRNPAKSIIICKTLIGEYAWQVNEGEVQCSWSSVICGGK